LCAATIDTFVSILASESGNVALKVLATGGLYLGGGVVTHTLPALRERILSSISKRRVASPI
jgi:glucokinase